MEVDPEAVPGREQLTERGGLQVDRRRTLIEDLMEGETQGAAPSPEEILLAGGAARADEENDLDS